LPYTDDNLKPGHAFLLRRAEKLAGMLLMAFRSTFRRNANGISSAMCVHKKKETFMSTTFDYSSASLAAIAAASAIVLAGCGPQNGESAAAAPTQETTQATHAAPVQKVRAITPDKATVGEVSSVEAITERPKGTGAGAVVGGVLGGVLGHQVGDGNGQKVATAAGAIGGAVLGNKVERDRNEKVVGYRVQVRLDNGETRTFQESNSGLRVGDRVRVDAGQLKRV
jgi:outer membrane lipoprotein SlyB